MENRPLHPGVDFRGEIEAVTRSPRPLARVLVPRGETSPLRSLAVMPGAYNPPTLAHLALAHAAGGLGFERVFFSLGSRILDKTETGLALEDRLALLVGLAGDEPGLGVVVQNRGLYAEMAEALRDAFPACEDLAFVVGMDKIPQLFDPRYYDDMPGSLATLFSRARFVVAPRGAEGRDALERRLAEPAALPFAERFEWLDFDPRWREQSATAVREELERGEHVDTLLPPAVAAFVRETGAFREPDRYAARVARLRSGR